MSHHDHPPNVESTRAAVREIVLSSAMQRSTGAKLLNASQSVLTDDRRGRYLKLSPLGEAVWDALAQPRALGPLIRDVYVETDKLAPAAVERTLHQLIGAGFVRPAGASPEQLVHLVSSATAKPAGARLQTIPGAARAMARLHRAAPWLTRKVFLGACLLVTVTGAGHALRHVPELTAVFTDLPITSVPAVWLCLTLSLIAHELGHGLAVLRFGRQLRRAGVGWYWFGPVAFVDTSDMWPCPRWQRITVSLAGPWVNLVIASSLAWTAALAPTSVAPLLWACSIANYLAAFTNLNPLFEYDGYHVLTDLVGQPWLRRRALGAMRSGRGSGAERLFGCAASAWLLVKVALCIGVARPLLELRMARRIPADWAFTLACGFTIVMVGFALFSFTRELRSVAAPE